MKNEKMSLLEVGHEMAQGLHEAGIIDGRKMEEFDKLCKPEVKYQPRFKPEDYLRFLNSDIFKALWSEYKSFEECMDAAILEIGLEKTLEKK